MRKAYNTDELGFLLDFAEWDEDFALSTARSLHIEELNEDHWRVIRFIRNYLFELGKCPLVFHTCRANALTLSRLQELFPTGYQRGACKLAGVTYSERIDPAKTYTVDAHGFLVLPLEWDEAFAANKALELSMGSLSEKHWSVIRYLRNRFDKSGVVPTVYQACEENGISLEELENLFPTGYHRGAVKLAGLRLH